MKSKSPRVMSGIYCGVLATVLTAAPPAFATPNNWTGGGDNLNWSHGPNWSAGVPAAGHAVTVAAGSILLADETAELASFTMTGGTLTFTNWMTRLRATEVSLEGASTLTLPPAFTDTQMSNRVWIACSNLTVETGSAINASGKGYAGGPPGSGKGGSGPGGGIGATTAYGGGGGHGGRGGWGFLVYWITRGGFGYGSSAEPSAPGSGGGTRADAQAYGGHGGGAIRIDAAGDVVVNGSLLANGTAGNFYSGGGSGGSIAMTCARFGGGGFVGANGGERANYGGSGGGGRIALLYQTIIGAPGIRLEAREGSNPIAFDDPALRWPQFRWMAEPGTLYLADASLLTTTLSNLYGQVSVSGMTEWTPASLTVDGTRVRFDPGFNLATAGGLTVRSGGALELGANATLACGGNLLLDGGRLVMNIFTQMNCSGNLVVTNGGRFLAGSAPTNGTSAHGASIDVAGDILIAPASWILPDAHPTNGGPVRIRAQRVRVAAGGGFDATGRGFGGGLGYLRANGYGPGAGTLLTYGSGAGYGGRGGDAYYNGWTATGGSAYGSSHAPVMPGSGGGSYYNSERGIGGPGGGTIWIEASESMTLDGALLANGGVANYASGGGSGGGIFVSTPAFQGASGAMIVANGSAGCPHDANHSGPGGGGRIAIAIGLDDSTREALIDGTPVAELYTYTHDAAYAGAITANASSAGPDYSGAVERAPGNGPFMFITTNVTLNIVGSPGNHGAPAPQAYGATPYLDPGTTLTNSVASPADELAGQRWVCTGWRLEDMSGSWVDGGTTTQAVFTLSATRKLIWNWTNEYLLAVSSGAPENGAVRLDANGWHTNGTIIADLWASPSNGYQFVEWTGDVPAGHGTDNPLTVTLDRTRTIVGQFASISGVDRYWNGSGLWETPANWTPNGMPGPYDHAIIASGQVVLSLPRNPARVTIGNGATLVFTNWTTSLTASNVTVASGGLVTLPAPFDNAQMSNRVWIVCTNLTVEQNGAITVDGKGYAGSPLGAFYTGSGPGGGLGGSGRHGAGGGYGGRGSWSYLTEAWNVAGGGLYATAAAPFAPGSGGGSRQEITSSGGHGGGAIRIEALGDVIVNGTLSANGTQGTYYGGGGSGGGICIAGKRFGGTGLLCANGGTRSNLGSGAGGGGRIALHYQSLIATPTARLECRNADMQVAHWDQALRWSNLRWLAEPGTLYLADTGLLSASVNNLHGRIVIPGFNSWAPSSLEVGSNARLQFGPKFKLEVPGNLTVRSGGALELLEDSFLDCGGDLLLDGGRLVMNVCTQMICRADLVATNGGRLYVYSVPTNGTSAHGASVDVAGDIRVASSSWILPDAVITNGGPVRFRASRVLVSAGGGFDADGRGYGGPFGVIRGNGYGPGAGVRLTYASGAGYGGRGGDAYWNGWNAVGGSAYGNTNAPVMPGSGGGAHAQGLAGHGGGVIWLEASQLFELNGTLTANGITTDATASGGGSGGGIFVWTPRFTGATGVLRANGGGGDLYSGLNGGGAGGGGRIAVSVGMTAEARDRLLAGKPPRGQVLDRLPTFSGTMSVSVGTTGPNYSGAQAQAPAVGTAFFLKGGQGGLLLLR